MVMSAVLKEEDDVAGSQAGLHGRGEEGGRRNKGPERQTRAERGSRNASEGPDESCLRRSAHRVSRIDYQASTLEFPWVLVYTEAVNRPSLIGVIGFTLWAARAGLEAATNARSGV